MEKNNNSVRETSNLEEIFRQTLPAKEIAEVDRASKNLGRLNRIGLFLPFAGSVVSALAAGSVLVAGYCGEYIDEAGYFTKEAPEYLTNLFYLEIPLLGGFLTSALLFPFNIPNYRKVKSYLNKYDTFVRNCELP